MSYVNIFLLDGGQQIPAGQEASNDCTDVPDDHSEHQSHHTVESHVLDECRYAIRIFRIIWIAEPFPAVAIFLRSTEIEHLKNWPNCVQSTTREQ